MSMNENDKSCLSLGVLNGSAKSFVKIYNERETHIQILFACMGVFAFTIFQDFIRAFLRLFK